MINNRLKFTLLFFITLLLNSCFLLDSNYSLMNSSRYSANTAYSSRKKILIRKNLYKVRSLAYSKERAYYRNQYKRASYYSVNLKKGSLKKYKMAPYVVFGTRYTPMTLNEALNYKKVGVASWYGFETSTKKNGTITANGEYFHPEGLSAAHKLLPLPVIVRVTNLKNNKTILVRVNDRGPFVGNRIIDLSAGAARKLGYYKKGIAKVLVKTIQI